MSVRQKIESLGYALPPTPQPAGSYVPAVRSGNLLFVAGQLPMKDGELILIGKVGPDGHNVDDAAIAARQCALNALAAVEGAVGLDNVLRVIRLGVFVNSVAGFTAQPKVANGASDLMVEVFGESGRHARAAVGVNELPLDAAVEIEFLFEVK